MATVSITLMNAVLDNFPHGGSAKLVMVAMARWADEDGGSIFPSMTTIAQRACISRSQAQRVVHGLVDDGYLRVMANAAGGAPGKTPDYQIVVGRLTGSTGATGRIDATGRTDAEEGSHPCGERGRTHATRIVIEESLRVNTSEKRHQATNLFAEFWKAYPKRVSKGQAEKAWKTLKPDTALVELILAGIARAHAGKWRRDDGKYIPHPATWLNAKGWLDEDVALPAPSQPRQVAL